MANTIHYDEIRRILTARRRELLNEIQNNLRDARAEASGQDRTGSNPAKPPKCIPRTNWRLR